MRKRVKPEPRRVNFILMDGGLGDHVASLVAVDYVIKNYPWITPLVWTPNYLKDLASHLLPAKTNVDSYDSMKDKYNHMITTKVTKWDGMVSPMKIHLLDYAFLKLTDENPGINHKNYLRLKPDLIDVSKFGLPDKYIVITAGFTAKAREFPAHHVNAVTKYAHSKGYDTVFLGQTKTQTGTTHVIEGNFDKNLDFSNSINLINETNLLEAAKIMHLSSAVVGVDNGLLHVAGCTDVPIVGGFTNVSPEVRMPVRNDILGFNFYPVTPPPSVCCHCQQNTNFLYGHDYRSCVFKDRQCVESMTAEQFILQLEKIL